MQIIDITPKIQAKTEKLRLAAYCRVSSDSKDQLHSFATQVKYYTDYARKNPEYELVDIYADEGLTGTKLDNRDELDRLLRDCKKGKIDRIIVKSMSRFMRNTQECLIALRALKDIGISVYFEEQGIDTNKLNSEMIVTFPGMLAQQESENISGNLRWGIQKRMASGDYICPTAPYGYTWVNKKLVINETEAAVVRRIFNLYLQGCGKIAITKILNQEGVPRNTKSKRWDKRAIDYILTNEKYIGDAILQKTYTTDGVPFKRKINKGQKKKYYVENYNPPIISKEIFYAVQNLLKSKQVETREKRIYILTKKIRCPDCGNLFRRLVANNKAYWNCTKFTAGEGCKSRRVREDMVYETFVDMIYKLKANREILLEKLIQRIDYLKMKTSQNGERIKQIDKEIADLSAKNLVITRLHSSGILGVSEYTMQTSEIIGKINELRVERRKKVDKDDSDIQLDDLRSLNDIIKDYKLNSKFDVELFSEIVEKIVVDDNTKLTFHLIGGVRITETIKEKGRCKVS